MPEAYTLPSGTPNHESQCAERILAILFKQTGVSDLVGNDVSVTVGHGNWISFVTHVPVSSHAIRWLRNFTCVHTRRAEARSKSSPSLHFVNLDSGENLRGHVDAYYWARHPLGHAIEFLTKRTIPPSLLLNRQS